MYKTKIFLAALILLSGFSACNQSGQTAQTDNDSASVNASESADLKDSKTKQVYEDYIRLKNDLVISDAGKVQQSAEKLSETLLQVEGCENTAGLASKIAGSDDLATQRTHFTALSSDIIALMEHADFNSGEIYVQHCPMANEGEGGYWLASEKEIRNPYYGDQMLECGSVEETISGK